MSLLTNFLKLFKYDPVADKDSTFNITKALNENWDKVDAELKRNSDADDAHEADLASQELNKGASLIGINDADNKFAATSVEGALKELFINVSDGKQVVATAITGKGVPTSSSDTFGKMATNIDAITTDPSIGTTNAAASDILATKKAISQGQLVTGTIPTFGGFPVATDFHPYGTGTADGGNNMYLKMPAGYSNGTHWLSFKDPNLIPANIKAGVSLGSGMKLVGTFTSDATIPDSSWLLTGASAYKNGIKINGSMVNHGVRNGTITTQGGSIAIPAGYTTGGSISASFANLVAGNVKNGVNVGGVVGNYKGQIANGVINQTSNPLTINIGFQPNYLIMHSRGRDGLNDVATSAIKYGIYTNYSQVEVVNADGSSTNTIPEKWTLTPTGFTISSLPAWNLKYPIYWVAMQV